MENKVFAERIKDLRIKNKLTQQELGSKFGLTSTGVSYWESGKAIPNIEMMNKLSDFFGVTIDYLIGNYYYYIHYILLLYKYQMVYSL